MGYSCDKHQCGGTYPDYCPICGPMNTGYFLNTEKLDLLPDLGFVQRLKEENASLRKVVDAAKEFMDKHLNLSCCNPESYDSMKEAVKELDAVIIVEKE